MLSETLRTRWFSLCLHAGLWLLLLLVVLGSRTGGRGPQLHEVMNPRGMVTTPVPVTRLKPLFAAANQAGFAVDPGARNLFETAHFVPAPALPPATVPAPPPPTTQKIELAYQGYYRTGDGPKYVLLRLGNKLISVPVGGLVVTNLFVVDADLKTLTLTNTVAQTNVLGLNAKQILDVPLK